MINRKEPKYKLYILQRATVSFGKQAFNLFTNLLKEVNIWIGDSLDLKEKRENLFKWDKNDQVLRDAALNSNHKIIILGSFI